MRAISIRLRDERPLLAALVLVVLCFVLPPIYADEAEPVTEYMEGWRCDVSGARRWTELPEAARRYVRRVEEEVGVPLGWLSVGPRREQYIRL